MLRKQGIKMSNIEGLRFFEIKCKFLDSLLASGGVGRSQNLEKLYWTTNHSWIILYISFDSPQKIKTNRLIRGHKKYLGNLGKKSAKNWYNPENVTVDQQLVAFTIFLTKQRNTLSRLCKSTFILNRKKIHH